MFVVFGTRGAPSPFTPVDSTSPRIPFQAIAHRGHLRPVRRDPSFAGQFGCFAETDDAGNVLRSRPARALVASAIEHGLQDGSLAHIQRAHSLRSMNLVSGNREQIAADALYVDGDLPRRLHGVRVEIDIGFGGNLADLFDGCSTPVSLLAIMMVMSWVFGRRARRTSSGSTWPRPSTGT